MASEKILGYLDSHRNEHVDQLVEFLKIPSISSQSDHDEDTRRAAAFVADELKELACLKFQSPMFMQSFCHTAAYPKPADVAMHRALPAFIADRKGVPLRPGDEVLTTDHEYGALDRAWRFVCAKRGARFVRQPVPGMVQHREGVLMAAVLVIQLGQDEKGIHRGVALLDGGLDQRLARAHAADDVFDPRVRFHLQAVGAVILKASNGEQPIGVIHQFPSNGWLYSFFSTISLRIL